MSCWQNWVQMYSKCLISPTDIFLKEWVISGRGNKVVEEMEVCFAFLFCLVWFIFPLLTFWLEHYLPRENIVKHNCSKNVMHWFFCNLYVYLTLVMGFMPHAFSDSFRELNLQNYLWVYCSFQPISSFSNLGHCLNSHLILLLFTWWPHPVADLSAHPLQPLLKASILFLKCKFTHVMKFLQLFEIAFCSQDKVQLPSWVPQSFLIISQPVRFSPNYLCTPSVCSTDFELLVGCQIYLAISTPKPFWIPPLLPGALSTPPSCLCLLLPPTPPSCYVTWYSYPLLILSIAHILTQHGLEVFPLILAPN